MPSSPATPTQIQQQMQALRAAYAEKIGERVLQIEQSWDRLVKDDWNLETLRTLHRMVHSLAGSGATFGFTYLGTIARTLEILLTSILETGNPPIALQRIQVHALLASLRQSIHEPEQNLPELTAFIPSQSPLPNRGDSHLIYLVDDDPELAEDLALQIGYFGYDVVRYHNSTDLKEAVLQQLPAAILTDITFSEGDSAGIEMISALRKQLGSNMPPVVFMSLREDLTARLEAARAGGKAYFTKPVSVPSLVDKLDELTRAHPQEAYRVLIVDDESHLAVYYSLILQRTGMVTQVVTDPFDLIPVMSEFNPDLILMDVYMPHCSGLELGTVIRQQPAYVGIPIVFLSTETDLNKQLDAMNLGGGDEFLTKPIQPDHLIMAVYSRAQRARTLRSLMATDSLTGLLNHTTTKEQLVQETLRAERSQSSLAFAMLDLDHFKSVNDTYGHATGDRVIKSLSRLLQQRLRRTDTIGRYGGEEFAVILPDTDGATACKIMNDIRQRFAQIRQQSEDEEFSATFSCGIAVYPTFSDVGSLKTAADKALYRAKHQGRNRVVLAEK
ncbi:diguanylate cyclase [Thermostichus vulcanus]|uniref:Diguanylate cyclase n=1 Tax=Thermostichus vulcanus str. 'Rupite' TaxID=2813851 RepID=A0ABT0CAW0_THEVL|nr:diguanylate cyclase [Thermostichus vulcanus]MCJ2542908.1 diguanylate cyclase [Thermostichus vulcanus str. 'Rupite']